MKRLKGLSVNKRLNILVLVSFVPFTIMVIYLLLLVNQFSQRYDVSVENITQANIFNISFKDDMDYAMYIIVVNSERADELVDTDTPNRLIREAREVFTRLSRRAGDDYSRNQLRGILKSLNTLEGQVAEIQKDARISGSYERNMERLDLDIRVMTELIQEQIQEYISHEAENLEQIREGIRSDVDTTIKVSVFVFVTLLAVALVISRRITASITKPVERLREAAKRAGGGDFALRDGELEAAEEEGGEENEDELQELDLAFHHMMGQIGQLVEDIRVEQLNLRDMELKLLQAQINPHFLYNTLDAIVWLAESNQNEQVITMVSALSDFFRSTLSKGRDYVTIQEEETHVRSYLQIQQFRYRDILEYEINIPEEMYPYQILKLTLQPVVENALYHGIKNKRGGGRIVVSGRKEGSRLILTVEDNGIGMNQERLEYVRKMLANQEKTADDSGFGLYNIEQRIILNYGQAYGMEIDSAYGEGTVVKITIPAVKK